MLTLMIFNWTVTWDLNKPLDLWSGIGIGPNGCVDVVDLSARNLSGQIPPEIGQLKYLNELNLSDNQLYKLSGEIAGAIRLTNLQLNNNRFNQNIPAEIGNLANLVSLDISHNLFWGEVPATLSNLNNLLKFRLNHNRLSGIIPPMSGLTHLYIGYNQFNFDTPEYWEQAGLEEFEYIIQDTIPIYRNGNFISVDAGGTLTNNTYVWYIGNYQYIGTTHGVPQFPISEPGRYLCDVFNDIADEIPMWSRSLYVYSISDLPCRERDSLALIEIYQETDGANWTSTWDLSQPLDTWHGVTLSDAGCVDKLDLKENGLTGTLPDAIGDMADMTVLYMQYNDIGGQIPANIGNLTNLEIIDLGDNDLEGEIPDAMSNMMRLKQLSLQRNILAKI